VENKDQPVQGASSAGPSPVKLDLSSLGNDATTGGGTFPGQPVAVASTRRRWVKWVILAVVAVVLIAAAVWFVQWWGDRSTQQSPDQTGPTGQTTPPATTIIEPDNRITPSPGAEQITKAADGSIAMPQAARDNQVKVYRAQGSAALQSQVVRDFAAAGLPFDMANPNDTVFLNMPEEFNVE